TFLFDSIPSRIPCVHILLLLRNAFADLHFEEKEIITTEDKVVAGVVMSGRHVNDFIRSPPTQRKFSAHQIHIFDIAGYKIIENRAVRDDLSMIDKECLG